jgi:hypothetical protein
MRLLSPDEVKETWANDLYGSSPSWIDQLSLVAGPGVRVICPGRLPQLLPASGAASQLFRLSKLWHPCPNLGTCGGKVAAMCSRRACPGQHAR